MKLFLLMIALISACAPAFDIKVSRASAGAMYEPDDSFAAQTLPPPVPAPSPAPPPSSVPCPRCLEDNKYEALYRYLLDRRLLMLESPDSVPLERLPGE